MYKLNPVLKDFWTTRKPYKLLKGGRFSSKTQDAGGMAAYLARNFSVKFLCIRQFQNRIADSVYTVIKQKIEEAGWREEFDIGVSTIRHRKTGSEFLFYGIARNIEDIKGTEGVDICWIEEGEGLTEEQWSTIDPTIRKEGAEIWVLWNPQLSTDFVQKKLPLLLGDSCIMRHINYTENPYLSDTALQKAERLKKADPDAYRHIYLGHPMSSDEMSIIKHRWIEASIDSHLYIEDFPMGGGKFGGFDVSGGVEGDVLAPKENDPNAYIWRHGCMVMGANEWQDENPNKAASFAHGLGMRNKLELLLVDDIGVGASVPGELDRLQHAIINSNNKAHRMRFKGWTASESPDTPDAEYQPGKTHYDMWANKKAQGWGLLADRFKNTWQARNGLPYNRDMLISIPADLEFREKLETELAAPHKRVINGREGVESKLSLKKRGIPSHNLADALVMCFAPEQGFDISALI